MTLMMRNTPNPKKNALEEVLTKFDRTGFKRTGKLQALVLADHEAGLLRTPALGEPLYDTTCLACGQSYAEQLGGMLRACTACTPLVTRFFPANGDWTREVF